MKSINITLWFSIIFSLIVTSVYIIKEEYVFSIVLLTFSLAFLTGFREFGKPSISYRIAHLYVGSILFSIASGYVFLNFVFSFVNRLIGESISIPTYADILLWLLGGYSLFNIYRLKKIALKPTQKNKN